MEREESAKNMHDAWVRKKNRYRIRLPRNLEADAASRVPGQSIQLSRKSASTIGGNKPSSVDMLIRSGMNLKYVPHLLDHHSLLCASPTAL